MENENYSHVLYMVIWSIPNYNLSKFCISNSGRMLVTAYSLTGSAQLIISNGKMVMHKVGESV